MELTTSTEIFELASVDTYSLYDIDTVFDTAQLEEDAYEYDGLYVDTTDIDMPAYAKILMAAVEDGLNYYSILSHYGVKHYSLSDFKSPREYNFRTDSALVKVEVEDDFLEKAKALLKSNSEFLDLGYLAKFKSRDGFISWCSDNTEDLIKQIEELQEAIKNETDYEDEYRVVGQVLSALYLIDPNWGEYDAVIIDDVMSRLREEENSVFKYRTFSDLQALNNDILDIRKEVDSIEKQLQEYLKTDVSDESKGKAEKWFRRIRDALKHLDIEQASLVVHGQDISSIKDKFNDLSVKGENTRDFSRGMNRRNQ